MGTGSSMIAAEDSDHHFLDEEEDELGVMTNIPVECSLGTHRKSTNGLSLIRSVGSFGKKKSSGVRGKVITKSTSLRSALSIDFESEVDKLKKEMQSLRTCKQLEIHEIHEAKQRLQSENRRLRSELKVVQSTCTKLRNDRQVTLEAKEQALQRALAFEKERDKVQRQFKIYREAKEKEIQDHLHTHHILEEKIKHLLHGQGIDQSHSGGEVVSVERNKVTTDWWMSSIGSEHSLEDLPHNSVLHGPDCSQALMEKDGVFTTVSRDDWNAALLQPSSKKPNAHLESPVIRIYLSAPQDMDKEVQVLKEVYFKKLESLCEDHGNFLVLVHLTETNKEEEFSSMLELRQSQIKQSNIFLAFLGERSNRFTNDEFQEGHLENPGKRCAIFCFKNPENDKANYTNDESYDLANKLKMEIRKSHSLKLFDNYETPEGGAQLAYVELSKNLKKYLHANASDSESNPSSNPDSWADSSSFDTMIDEQEQLEALKAAANCSLEVDFTTYFSELNVHLSSTGFLLPMLVMGDDGSGKSLLMAKWINLQQVSMPSHLILYHFVGISSSSSACPILMLRQLTLQLLNYMRCSSMLPSDPVSLEEEFLRCLEKCSSKIPGGVTIVIDSADRLQDINNHMQWLLDPLPVGTRVILSVSTGTCAQAWNLWPTLHLQPISKTNQSDLLSSLCDKSLQDQISGALSNCPNEAALNPRFLHLLAAEINSCKKLEYINEDINQQLSECLNIKGNVDLLCHIIKQQITHDEAGKDTLKQVLLHIALSRNGLTEPELLTLVPMEWIGWLQLYDTLKNKHILTNRVGQITLASQQVYCAVWLLYQLDEDSTDSRITRQRLIEFYDNKIKNCLVTRRLIDEMPWLLRLMGQKNKLKECLLDLNIFSRFFERGRVCELVQYWKYVGEEQSNLGKLYLDVIKSMDGANDDPSAAVADLLVAVGLFLKCLGLLSQAAPPLHKALEIRESALDPDHPLVAQSLHHLAELYAHWGNFSAAEAFYKQAIEITQNTYGSEHQTLIKDLEGLSILYKKNEKYSLAEIHYKRSIAIRRKTEALAENHNIKRMMLQAEELVVGPASSEVAKSLNELGVLFYLQNNHETAQSFLQRSLDMREEVLGKEHPDVAQSLHNLAALYNDLKMCDKAEPLYKRALEIRMKTLPPHHASLASTVNHLAVLFRKQGKYAEAEPLYRQALEARENVLGENHPSVGTALNNLAVVLCLQDKQSEALPLYEHALKIYEESLGSNHPRVAQALVNVAKLYYDQGQHEAAVQLYKQASEIQNGEPSQRLTVRRASVGMLSQATKRSSPTTPPDGISIL